FSPLYPVSSTVSILTNQLIYVTIISLILAFLLSFYLSNRIARPIRSITRQAKKLANGQYGIIFQGGHYTEIINLANTLTHTSLQLEKANTLQKDLIANVSHDLRTPLTMVKSYAEMIRDLSGDVPEKRNSHLQVIIEEADRLNLLVSDMLTLSRLQSGVVTVEPESFSMKDTAESIIHAYTLLEEQEGYSILLDCPEDIMAKGDPMRIKQVVSNLLNNAVKYCGQDKTVFVSVRRVRNKMRCEVTDHGMGIESSEFDQIWDRYYKASTNHIRTTTGTGLGLSIVKEILTLHNSKFGVISQVGKGSTFWFELEIARGPGNLHKNADSLS
ncbi:MAG: HAMP domain-containing sensor histidine kinase, partial [Anaerovorax sp.]